MISFFRAEEFYSLKRKRCILSSVGLKSKLESGRVSSSELRDARQMNNNKTIPARAAVMRGVNTAFNYKQLFVLSKLFTISSWQI